MSSSRSVLPNYLSIGNTPDMPSGKSSALAVFFAFVLLVANYMSFNMFGITGAFSAVTRIGAIVLFAAMFVKRPVVSSIAVYLILACLAAAVVGGVQNNIVYNIIFIVFAVCCMRNVSFDLLVDYSLMTLFTALVLTFLLLALGLTENTLDIVADRERASFGFSNVNAFTTLVYAFVTLALYRWKGKALIKYAVLSAVCYVTYVYTDSRTLIASISVFIFAHGLFVCFSKNLLKIVIVGMLALPIILTQLSGYIAEQVPLLDIALSFRPSYSADFMKGFSFVNYFIGGISPGPSQTIDNSFMLLEGAVGLPFVVGLAFLAYKRLSEAIHENCPETFCLIISFWYFCYSESSMARPETIIGLIFWMVLYKFPAYYRIPQKSLET